MIALFVARHQNSVPGFYERAFGALTYTYNLVNDIKGDIHPTWVSFNQIWSLSIEEQFYLVVPLGFVWMPTRWLLPVSALLIVGISVRLAALCKVLVVGVFSPRRSSEARSSGHPPGLRLPSGAQRRRSRLLSAVGRGPD